MKVTWLDHKVLGIILDMLWEERERNKQRWKSREKKRLMNKNPSGRHKTQEEGTQKNWKKKKRTEQTKKGEKQLFTNKQMDVMAAIPHGRRRKRLQCLLPSILEAKLWANCWHCATSGNSGRTNISQLLQSVSNTPALVHLRVADWEKNVSPCASYREDRCPWVPFRH